MLKNNRYISLVLVTGLIILLTASFIYAYNHLSLNFDGWHISLKSFELYQDLLHKFIPVI